MTLPQQTQQEHEAIENFLRAKKLQVEQDKLEAEKQRDVALRELALLKLQSNKVKTLNHAFIEEQWIYLCQTPHCFELHNDVYKVGRTSSIEQRKRGYPKGTIFFACLRCTDAQSLETSLLHRFRALFKSRKDYGVEYFEGQLPSMLRVMYEEQLKTVPVMERVKNSGTVSSVVEKVNVEVIVNALTQTTLEDPPACSTIHPTELHVG